MSVHNKRLFSEKKICGKLLNVEPGTVGTLSHTIDASALTFDGHYRWHIQASVNNCRVVNVTATRLVNTFYVIISEKKVCGELRKAEPDVIGILSHSIDATDLTFDGHCRWHIQASVNNTVELKIVYIDFTSNTECDDSLEVSNLYYYTESELNLQSFALVSPSSR